MIRVLIADDHAITRARLRAGLEQYPDQVTVVAETGSPDEAAAGARTQAADVVLLGLAIGAAAGEVAAPAYVLVVPDDDSAVAVPRALAGGARGRVREDSTPAALLAAVRSAAGRAPTVTLSAREHETLSAVAQGLSNREAARSLFLSEATVKAHLVHVFHKLKVKSRADAVSRARQLGLID